jgi:hypothetical protein
VGRLKEILFTRKAITDVLGLIPLHPKPQLMCEGRPPGWGDFRLDFRRVPRFSRMVAVDEIEKNDCRRLKHYWAVCPKLRKTLFKPNRSGYVDLAVEKTAIKPTIYEHPEFTAFITGMNAHFAEWRATNAARLKTLKAGCHPKLVIAELAEDLLARYTHKPLISPYDIYST